MCRKTEKILEFFDLSVFCFRAPFHFKYEANLLKVEVGIKGKKLRKVESRIRRESKRKRGKDRDQYSSEDEEDEEEEGDEVEAKDMVPARAKETTVEIPADDAHATGFLVEEPDQSAMIYRNDGDEPPYRQYADKDKGMYLRTETLPHSCCSPTNKMLFCTRARSRLEIMYIDQVTTGDLHVIHSHFNL